MRLESGLDHSPIAHAIEQRLLTMAPVQAMQLRWLDHGADHVRLQAPLAANLNDKGCAFGGSLTSLMTLAAWALMSMKLEQAGSRADIYVQDSSVRYLVPLYDDLQAQSRLAEGQDWDAILASFSQRNKARALLQAEIRDHSGRVCCTLEGRFVALPASA